MSDVLSLLKGQLIYVSSIKVTREGRGFKVYLPKAQNELWSKLQGKEVQVYIKIPEEGLQ